MENCIETKCKLNHDGKCYSGDGNLKYLNPWSKKPSKCLACPNGSALLVFNFNGKGDILTVIRPE